MHRLHLVRAGLLRLILAHAGVAGLLLRHAVLHHLVVRRLARLRTPVEIGGHLRKPTIGIDAGKTLKQGAIATALGAVLTPLAAIFAFVDPGLAKDENCAALLASSTQSAAAGEPVPARVRQATVSPVAPGRSDPTPQPPAR